MIELIAKFVAGRPKTVLVLMLLITLFPGYYAFKGLSLTVKLEEMLPVNAPNIQLYWRFSEQFGGANVTLIEVKTTQGSIYTTEFLEKYKRISDDVYYHPDTIRHLVQSLALRKTKSVAGGGGRVEIEAIMWPDVPKTEQELATFRRNVNNQYRGFLVSDDETSAVIIAEFKDEADFSQILTFLNGLKDREEDGVTNIHMAGRPILLGNIYQALDEIFLILAFSVLLIMAILYGYFRTWVGVVAPLIAASAATVWGLGAMAIYGYNLDPLLILLPAFVFAIVMSHGVQLTSRVLEQIEVGKTMREAVRFSLARLLVPSSAAIVTDAAGFAALGLVAIPSIKALALICGVWLLSILPALLLAAATLCILPIPQSHRRHSALLQKFWGNVISMESHKLPIILGTALLLVVGVIYSKNLEIGDAKGSAIMWEDSRYNQDVESINTRYSRLGTDMMQVYIEGGDKTMLDPNVYHELEALDRYIYENVPEARPSQSLVPVIKLINAVLYEGDPSYELIPDTEEEIGFDIYMFRSRGEPGDFAAYTDSEWRIGNLSTFVEDHSVPTIARLTKALDGYMQQENRPKTEANLLYSGGAIGITESLNDAIAESNFKIMVAITLAITLCIILYYRSFIVCLVLITSLATANALTYAFMAWNGVGLNISTLPLSALGVGLGVDYGIYMIDRIREEFRVVGHIGRSIAKAFMTSGNAIFITAVTMIAPLVPWIFISPLRFQAEMGMLLAIVLLMNMLAAMLFVPAALTLFKPKAIFGKHLFVGQGVVGASE